MTDLSVSTSFGSLATYSYPSGYDQNKLGLGTTMIQANDVGNEGKWVGPTPNAIARPVETTAAIPGIQPDGVSWSPSIDWIVLADNAVASATRRFQLWTFNRAVTSNPWSFIGAITCTLPFSGTQGTYTNRGHSVVYETYTTGTVSISNGSTSLTGSGSTWSASRLFIGSRIGFGSTNPANITKWYEIGAIGSDTGITLTQSFTETTLSGASYVIEDLRILFVMTNAVTTTNAGLFMVAGLRFDVFTTVSTVISAATTVDKIRAVYWLSDGNATNNATNITYGGIALDTRTSWTSQKVYCLDAVAGQSRFQITNFRTALSLTAGRDTATYLLNTGQQAVVGTNSQVGNLVLCTPSHGPRNGVKSVFWVTTTRFYSADVSNLTSGSTVFQSGVATEVPPGSTTTFTATSTLNSINYSTIMDRFFIFTTSATGARHYVTQYREDTGQWDRIILCDGRQTLQSTADSTAAVWPVTLALQVSGININGITYLTTHGTTAITNLMYAVPFTADWEFSTATNQRIVTPVFNTNGFANFISGFFKKIEVIGGKTGTNLGMEPGAVRMYYRTSGISDNSGSWTLLDDSGDMSSVPGASQIQAMLEFRMMNLTGIPSRVCRVGFLGTGSSSDGHFQFSQNLSSTSSKQFTFRYSTAFGTTVPTLYIRIYDAVNNSLLVTDNSASPTGTWEKSTNGSSWGSFNTSDRANETTYFRYTPASIADNVNALPVISLS